MNNNVRFTSYPKPIQDESFTGYILRVAEKNCEDPISIIKYICGRSNINMKYLDIQPELKINSEIFRTLFNVDSLYQIKSNTYGTILDKLGIIDKYNASTLLDFFKNIISNHRKICPACIIDTAYYKLIWQLEDIDFCNIHKVQLVDVCPNCKSKLKILSKKTKVGFCEECNFEFSKVDIVAYSPSVSEELYYSNWEFLMSSTDNGIFNLTNISLIQYVAMFVIYLINDESKGCLNLVNFKKYDLDYHDIYKLLLVLYGKNTINYFADLFRLLVIMLSKKGYHLSSINNFDITNISIYSHQNILKSICSSVSCIAPYCKSNGKKEKLILYDAMPRVTKTKEPCYFFYCPDCGVCYYYLISSGDIVERGDKYITEGYEVLCKYILNKVVFSDIPLPPAKKLKYLFYFLSCDVLPLNVCDFYSIKKIDGDSIRKFVYSYVHENKRSINIPTEIKYYKEIIIERQLMKITSR